MLAIIMILAACSSGTDSTATEQTSATGTEATTGSTETNTDTSSGSDNSNATRIYKSLSGDVEIPAEPETDRYGYVRK
ncbi:hypothetical protein Q0F98_13540 [Paenibacillus amylolyticus]|nr:hypothetical protein Q0F98_13540 [Paenibacillus amylolyticus]